MRRRLVGALVTVPLLLTMALAACSDPDSGGEIPTAGGTTPADDDGGTGAGDVTEAERHEMELAFAACLREHGIDVADPKPGDGVRIDIQGDPAEANAAIEQCRHLLPDGGEPPEDDPQERERMLAFAQCMRDNGVASFADPEPGEGTHAGPEQFEDPDFESAEQKIGRAHV